MQLLSSIVVSGIMCYFVYHLHSEQFPIPWTFINLLCISIATIASLTATIVLYNFTYLAPKFNLVLNGAITFFWFLGLGLLSMSLSRTDVLIKQCTPENWDGPDAAGVCRDYKALWGMTLVGSVSSFLAFLLDIHTQRKVTKRGVYIMPEYNQDAQRLNGLKDVRVRSEGYDEPVEQNEASTSIFDSDIGYHNRYGNPDEGAQTIPDGPLGEHRAGDMGYHNRFFHD